MALKKSITMSGDAKVEINGVTSVVPSYSHTAEVVAAYKAAQDERNTPAL